MTTLSLVYQEIKEQLLDRIGTAWPAGTRLPPTPELARELGAGQRNTLRAVQELVGEGYLQSRPGRGTFVARQLPSHGMADSDTAVAVPKTRVLVLMPPTQDRFVVDIVESFATAMPEHQCDITYHWIRKGCDLRKAPYCGFDAIAVIHPDGRPVKFNPNQKVVIISPQNRVNVDATGGYDIVSVDEEHGGFMAGRLLRAAGCESASFLGVRDRPTRTITDPTSAARLRGFEAGWGEPLDDDHLLWVTAYCITSPVITTVSRFAEMNPRPHAIFAASDDLAMGFAMGTLQLGLIPGRDYQLIGFDGQHVARSLSECPPITSIAIPSAEMGERAAQLLLQRMEKPTKSIERVLLGCSVFRGETLTNLPEETSS